MSPCWIKLHIISGNISSGNSGSRLKLMLLFSSKDDHGESAPVWSWDPIWICRDTQFYQWRRQNWEEPFTFMEILSQGITWLCCGSWFSESDQRLMLILARMSKNRECLAASDRSRGQRREWPIPFQGICTETISLSSSSSFCQYALKSNTSQSTLSFLIGSQVTLRRESSLSRLPSWGSQHFSLVMLVQFLIRLDLLLSWLLEICEMTLCGDASSSLCKSVA